MHLGKQVLTADEGKAAVWCRDSAASCFLYPGGRMQCHQVSRFRVAARTAAIFTVYVLAMLGASCGTDGPMAPEREAGGGTADRVDQVAALMVQLRNSPEVAEIQALGADIITRAEMRGVNPEHILGLSQAGDHEAVGDLLGYQPEEMEAYGRKLQPAAMHLLQGLPELAYFTSQPGLASAANCQSAEAAASASVAECGWYHIAFVSAVLALGGVTMACTSGALFSCFAIPAGIVAIVVAVDALNDCYCKAGLARPQLCGGD